MSKQAVTLIFDIGKTTKKVLIFDQDFHVIEEHTENFEEIHDDDGYASENLQQVTQWVLEKIDFFVNHPNFAVTDMNFSAYGASLVHLSKDGNFLAPFYNYLKPFPESCKKQLLEQYDKQHDLSTSTASPFLGLLNSGLQLYWLKHKKPTLFADIDTTLHLPQYFHYLFTKKKFSEITSIGCHTMLWDFAKQDYHAWVDEEKLRRLFPPVYRADHTVTHRYNGVEIKAGIGVHDSSAALMPYLVVMKEKFLLLSTGTWNICFNPFNDELLTHDELSQDCLCYITFEGKPVKASRIFLGHEHEIQQKTLASYFKVGNDHYKEISFNPRLYQDLKHQNAFIDFSAVGMEGTGPALNANPSPTEYSRLKSFEEAQHQLVRQLVIWQKISIDLIDPKKKIKNLIVVGGFTKSKLFLEIMKLEIPEREILISDHPRATALGAAWLVCGEQKYRDKAHLLNVLPA